MSYKSIGFKPGELKKIKYISDMTGLTKTAVVRSILVSEFSKFDKENSGKEELQMSFKKNAEKGKLSTLTVLINDSILEKMEPYLDITELTHSSFIRSLVIPVINQLYDDILENGVSNALALAVNANIGKLGDFK